MAKRMRSWNRAKYEQYIKSGRGQGEGSSYLPWISVHDFSSHGTVSRIAGHKTNLEEMLYQVNKEVSPLPVLNCFDEEYGLEDGSGVQILKHLLWTKQLSADMDVNLPWLISARTGGLAWSA